MNRLRIYLAQRRLARMLEQRRPEAERYRRNRDAQLKRRMA
jgi:hypothetical protein